MLQVIPQNHCSLLHHYICHANKYPPNSLQSTDTPADPPRLQVESINSTALWVLWQCKQDDGIDVASFKLTSLMLSGDVTESQNQTFLLPAEPQEDSGSQKFIIGNLRMYLFPSRKYSQGLLACNSCLGWNICSILLETPIFKVRPKCKSKFCQNLPFILNNSLIRSLEKYSQGGNQAQKSSGLPLNTENLLYVDRHKRNMLTLISTNKLMRGAPQVVPGCWQSLLSKLYAMFPPVVWPLCWATSPFMRLPCLSLGLTS